MFSIQHRQEEIVSINDFALNTHKASFRYTDLDIDNETNKINLSGKQALFFVSVGQAYHEKGKLLATIELINKQPFQQCDIVLADTLQRYNHAGRIGMENANTYTRESGDLWMQRNAYALSQLKLPHKIIRWDDLLFHKDYPALRAKVDAAYNENADYKDSIHTNVLTYIERLAAINPDTDQETLFNNGLGYLIEECPIVMPMWAQMGYDYIIYPKPLTPGMRKTYELFVADQYEDKCKWIYLRFKKR